MRDFQNVCSLKTDQQTILVVDGDQTMTRHYARIFEGKYGIVTASSGHQAIRLSRQSSDIHLVLLEYRLSDMSGIDVLKEIKKCRPSTPVILVTAFGDETAAVKAFRHGAKDYIKKPFTYNDLMGRVAFCLSLKHADKTRCRFEYSEEEHLCSPSLSIKHHNILPALQYIDDHFMLRNDLGTIAQKVCLSKYHFSRTFRKATGITYQEYVTRCRVEKAKSLLKDPSLTVMEVALLVGYSDPNNLIRNFRKHTGCTPTGFRKRHNHGRPAQVSHT